MAQAARWLAALLATLAGSAVPAASLDYTQALDQARSASGQVQGAQLDAQAKGLQSEAVQNLDGPSASLSAFGGRVSTAYNFDISQLASAVGAIGSAMPSLGLPTLPSTWSGNRVSDLSSLSLNALWPLYTGGRLQALHGLAQGRADEAQAELQEAEDKNATTVAQRYFTLQLARQALQVRRAALADMAEHRHAATRLQASGLIATAERLKADVALDAARRDLARSQNDFEMAQVALDRLMASSTPVQPTTPLFVNLHAVASLQSFIDAGMAHNPAWKKLAAKRVQAEHALTVQGRAHDPSVFAVGSYELNRGGHKLLQPNWAVGLMVTVPLAGGIDKGKMRQAAELDRQRVAASTEQAQRDVPTLIESQWRALENARAQFAAMDSTIRLARENLRLQSIAFEQRQSTTLDVADARLNVSRAETERLQSAYDYVLALARLLEATGEPTRLAEYAASADLQLSTE